MTGTLKSFGRSLIGDKAFYKKVLVLTVPIALQNALINVVGMLDNIMVGQIGTNEMSGVSIVNNLLFIVNLVIFGAVSAGGIFSAQFYGKGDHKGVAESFRSKLYLSISGLVIALLLFSIFPRFFVGLYLNEDAGGVGSAVLTMEAALSYMRIMLIGLPALCISMVYCSTMRECEQSVIPMRNGFIEVLVDLVLNYLLIFGKFGFPEMGVEGAAIATVVARYVDCGLNMLWVHTHSSRMQFIKYAFKTLKISKKLFADVIKKGMPLMINEFLWVCSMAITMQAYAYRGLTVVAANNINSSICNIFNIFFISLGNAVGIIVGQLLGAGKVVEAKAQARKLIFFSSASCLIFMIGMISVSQVFPQIYNTEPEVKALATQMIIVYAVCMPIMAYCNAAYFAIRSGGKTLIALLMDGIYSIVFLVPFCQVL